jgi:hypothetical protein
MAAGIVTAGALLLFAAPVAADNLTFRLGANTIQFISSNPSVPSVPAVQNPISVEVRYSGRDNWVLTVSAGGDLVSGANTIPISNVFWTASGTSFVPGTLSRTQAVPVANGGRAPSGDDGTLRFFLKESWDYASGSYAQSLTFTIVTF